MDIQQALAQAPGGILLFDGGMGSMIQAAGLAQPGKLADLLVLENPQAITDIHAAYVQAGSDIIITNTFSTNAINLQKTSATATVEQVYAAAVQCARAAGARYVAGDIGPCGQMLEPYGDFQENEALELFGEQARAAEKAGADLIAIETMMSLDEMLLALAAARANTKLPVSCTMSFNADGRTLFGITPEQAAAALEEGGASLVGMNCSTGPEDMLPLVARMRAVTSLPIVAQPNAGLPVIDEAGKATYVMEPAEFAAHVSAILNAGATIIGGCCGTNPQFIAQLNALRRQRAEA